MMQLPPLLQLRARWREAVAIHAPQLADEIDDLLSRALDFLEQKNAVTEQSLTTVVDVVINAMPGREDNRQIVRAQLIQAIHEYAATALVGQNEISPEATAFASEEALSAALLGMAHGDVSPEASMESVAIDQQHPVVDLRSLERSLKASDLRSRVVRTGRLVLLVVAVVAALAYLVISQSIIGPQPNPTPSASTTPLSLLSYSGTLDGSKTICGGSTSGAPNVCDVQLQLTGSGQLKMVVDWNTADALAASILDASGHVVASQTNNGGHLEVTTPVIGAGQYVFVWTATPTGPLKFTANVLSG